MEKTWDDFYKSGKVTDYLKYRGCVGDDMLTVEKERYQEERYDGTDSGVDRDGAYCHARG